MARLARQKEITLCAEIIFFRLATKSKQKEYLGFKTGLARQKEIMLFRFDTGSKRKEHKRSKTG